MGNRPKYSDKELIDGLQSLADELGQRPTGKQMRTKGQYSVNAYKRAFGSWNAAIEAAGFEPSSRGRTVTQDDLIESLWQLADELGRSPTISDINEYSNHSAKTYYRKFDGGLEEAKGRVELEHRTAPQNVDRVVVECADCGGQLERTPSQVKSNEYHYCSQECHYQHNSERYAGEDNPAWNSVEVECATCGDQFYRKAAVVEDRNNHFCSRECYGQWRTENVVGERHPRWTEYPTLKCEFCGKPYTVKPSEEQRSRFCSKSCQWNWNQLANEGERNPHWKGGRVTKICDNCGREFNAERRYADTQRYCSNDCKHEDSHPSGPDHPRYLGDTPARTSKDYLGPYWDQERLAAIIRDQARCQEPVCRMTEPAHLKRFGRGVHVHHIIDRREFIDGDEFNHQEANRLNNLITLCNPHHMERHG